MRVVFLSKSMCVLFSKYFLAFSVIRLNTCVFRVEPLGFTKLMQDKAEEIQTSHPPMCQVPIDLQRTGHGVSLQI